MGRVIIGALSLLAWMFLAHEKFFDFWIIAPCSLINLMGLIDAMIKYERSER